MINLFIIQVYAQEEATIINPLLNWTGTGEKFIGNLISAAVGMFLVLSFIFALLYFLLGGFSWITAAGDKTKLQSAQDRITHALVGLIIVVSTWAIMTLVGQFVGIDFPNLPIPTLESPGAPPGGNPLFSSCRLPYECVDRQFCLDRGTIISGRTGCNARTGEVCCNLQ